MEYVINVDNLFRQGEDEGVSKSAKSREVYAVQTNNLTVETTYTTCIIRNFPPKYLNTINDEIIIDDEEEKKS